MSNLSPEFLVVRGGDLLVLGVRWSDFDVQRDAATGRSRLTATSDSARVVLRFPPQAIAEEKHRSLATLPRRDARLSGSSVVAFAVPRGTSFELSAEGLLGALLQARGTTLAAPTIDPTASEGNTAIELPWGLIVSAAARSAGGLVVSDHSPIAIASPLDVIGLWHARLRADDGTPIEAGLALRPLRIRPDDLAIDTSPLSAADRQAIVNESMRLAPRVKRLELSALGGSFSARAIWPTLEWDHDTTLGRDQRVRLLAKGVLYPFGHRVEFQELVERTFAPPPFAANPATPAIASLQKRLVLTVTEPIRGAVEDDARLARQFPFSAIEIRQVTFTDLQDADWRLFHRRPFAPGALQDQKDELIAAALALAGPLQAILDAQPLTLDDFIAQGFGSTGSLQAAQSAAGAAEAELGSLVQQQADIDRQIDLLEQSPEPDFAEIQFLLSQRPTNQMIQQASAALAQANADVAFFTAVVANEFANLPRTFAALEASGVDEARQWRELQEQIAAVQALIEQDAAIAGEDHKVFFLPRTSDGRPLAFPIRCAGTAGDVSFGLPLLFVRDFDLPATDRFPRYASLTDGEITAALAAAWAPHSQVPLQAARIDLVRSAAPKPGDAHEVHELVLAAVSHGGSYRPRVSQIEVELPTLRALLPGVRSRVPFGFSEEFLSGGDAAEVVLRPLAEAIAVDFTDIPDRSGGLVSPRFAADAMSRTLGPVAEAALPGAGVPDLASVYEGATLLGFPLASVIDVGGPGRRPQPPTIVPLIENGQPIGARMSWTDLGLKSHGPLRANPGSTLTLTVDRARTHAVTTCTVSNFSLVLPPSGPELLTLKFGAVVFTQKPGRAPDLAIDGLDLQFAGSLKLLQTLQETLQPLLGGIAPAINVTPAGITAGFGLALPSVASGAFLLRNIAVHLGVVVPFTKKPVTVSLGFASRENPFNLSVLLFGGGGYIDIQVGGDGLTRIEASLEFGASVAIDFVIASGEVHALGGVHFVKEANGDISLGGFIRIGGSVEVLGLVSVSVELVVLLKYQSERNRLVGRASLVIEVDLTLISESVTIDSGEWELIGSDTRRPLLSAAAHRQAREADLAQWRTYRRAFAS